LTNENAVIKGRNAQSFLNNALFKEAVLKMDEYLEAKMLKCDLTQEGAAERIILSKQLLKGIVRELNRFSEDGNLAEFQLREIKPRVASFQR